MFNLFKRNTEETIQRKLLGLSDEIAQLSREVKQIKHDLESLEIKALESRKIYKKKLEKLTDDDEKNDISPFNPVILPER